MNSKDFFHIAKQWQDECQRVNQDCSMCNAKCLCQIGSVMVVFGHEELQKLNIPDGEHTSEKDFNKQIDELFS